MATKKRLVIGITGASGFIGSNLLQFLKLKKKYKIVKIDRNNLNIFSDDRIFFSKFDVIVHLAGVSKGDDSSLLSNILLTQKIIKSITSTRHPYVIFASSFAVYSSQKNIIKINTNVEPRNFYGWSKKWCEDLLLSAFRSKICGLAILRISNVYGQTVDSVSSSVVSSIMKQVNADQEILLTGDGNQKRDFLYVDDLSNAIYLVIERYARKNKFFMENICTGVGVSLNYIAKSISDNLNKEMFIKYTGKVEDFSCWIGDPKPVYKKLKWKPKIDIDTGIKRMI